ncbi:MAG: bifunctional hydroxymethylpyrimidine kinase/phosphomethylpyrimidine kinase [Alphaproteobacteria bacterium]
MIKPPRILSIAGSDPSGGAGLQADIKTITALGGYAAAAVTAVTVQNTKGVRQVKAMSAALIVDQIHAVLDDIGVDAIKIGLLPNAEIVEAVLAVVEGCGVPIVLDPVGISGTGHSLQEEDGAKALVKAGFAGAIITPNLAEAARLSGRAVDDEADMTAAGLDLRESGAGAVLVTGGHLSGDEVVDLRLSDAGVRRFAGPRIASSAGHGTGCTLSSAMAVELGRGGGLDDAIIVARRFVRSGLETAPGFGGGLGPLNHLSR